MEAKRCAVVSGANRGIGHEICRQLANEGVVVVATARDEKRGIEAVENLKLQLSSQHNNIVFHQLDVVDEASISSLVDFVKTNFGKLDILVNNAGTTGVMIKGDGLILKEMIEGNISRIFSENEEVESDLKTEGAIIQTYELAEQCLNTNYRGPKRMIEAFLPLLHLSHSPRIVNVSSILGNLKLVSNERAREVLSNGESLSEERVEKVVNEFLKDMKEGEAKGWPRYASAYKVSKAAVNAYTRILAQKYPKFLINCVCPGYVKTDMTVNTGMLTPAEGAENVVHLALLPDDGPTGFFFSNKNIMAF